MAKKPSVPKLPERDRIEKLQKYLAVLNEHPSLRAFRAVARTGPERQLALMAALERAVVVGPPAAAPPHPDDEADLILCDILDVIDSDPELKKHGSAYGPDRYLINLQAFGVWRGTGPIEKPTARELFATSFSHLTAGPASGLTASKVNTSPAPQVSGFSGEVIDAASDTQNGDSPQQPSPQTIDGVLVVTTTPDQLTISTEPDTRRILRHETVQAGEVFDDAPPEPRAIPARPVRRGQPPKLDEMAKGRLLGMMAYGLSFRQAAAQLGVHHQTLLNTLKRDEEFAQQIAEARLDAISQPLLTVIHASRTSWRAAAWLAKFLEERRVRNIETTPEERAVEAIKQR